MSGGVLIGDGFIVMGEIMGGEDGVVDIVVMIGVMGSIGLMMIGEDFGSGDGGVIGEFFMGFVGVYVGVYIMVVEMDMVEKVYFGMFNVKVCDDGVFSGMGDVME